MSNYVLNETNLSDDQNPPCMNAAIEDLINYCKKRGIKKYLINNINRYYA